MGLFGSGKEGKRVFYKTNEEIELMRNANLLVSKTLKDLEESLPSKIFLRVHKSHLVNRLHIKNLLPEQRMTLSNGDVLEVSRRRWAEVQAAVG